MIERRRPTEIEIRRRSSRAMLLIAVLGLVPWILICVHTCSNPARAQAPIAPSFANVRTGATPPAADVVSAAAAVVPAVRSAQRVPAQAAMYRRFVEQAVAEVWGVEGSSARLAAQLHQESAWRPRARSHVGAQGMAQFMPATARWIAEQFPDQLGKFDPWDPRQAALAAAIYDDHLYRRVGLVGDGALTTCSRWAFTLRAYNGGEKYLRRERLQAVGAGANGNDWLDVERYRARGVSTHKENIGYPRRILLNLEPAYIAAGWPGLPTCEGTA